MVIKRKELRARKGIVVKGEVAKFGFERAGAGRLGEAERGGTATVTTAG